MNEPAAWLSQLDDAAGTLGRLDDYRSPAELAAAVTALATALERALRLRLRGDPSAPDGDRLAALSPKDFPLDRVVQSLRTRDLLSLETAGTVHELMAADARARAGDSRPSDADVARRAVARLRIDLGTGGRASVPPAPPAVLHGDAAGAGDESVPPERRGRGMAWLGAGLAVLFVVALAWVLARGGTADYDAAVTAFRAGRMDSAAAGFERVLEDRPGNVNALLYLGRIHRREGRFRESSESLREAARRAPSDADVRRELGHLFMDLGQPRAAVEQYERALELDPEGVRTWAGLIRALRAAGDPRADRLLADAPADVHALLGRPGS